MATYKIRIMSSLLTTPNTKLTREQTKLVKKIKRKIKRGLANICDGYTVIEKIADGADDYGIKYWIECKNGFGARSWDLIPAITNSIRKYIKQIIEDGITYNNEKYYIHENLFYQICTVALRSKLYSNDYKFDFNVELLSKEEYQKVKTNIEKIDCIIEKINQKYEEIYQKNVEEAKEIFAQKQQAGEFKQHNYYYPHTYLRYIKPQPKYFTVFQENVKYSPRTSIELFSRESKSEELVNKYT